MPAPILSDLTTQTAAIVAPLYGLLAIFNGLGRFFWGSVSDRIGRPMTYTSMYLIQAVIFFFLAVCTPWLSSSICFAIVLACYGGGFGVMPSFTADYFGTKHLGQIYGFILTAWGLAGLVGPLVAAWVKDHTGSFTGAMPWVAAMLVIAAIIPFFVKKPAPGYRSNRKAATRLVLGIHDSRARGPATAPAFELEIARENHRRFDEDASARRYRLQPARRPVAQRRL